MVCNCFNRHKHILMEIMIKIIDLKDKQAVRLFEALKALNTLFDIGYHEYDEVLFVKMLNDTNAEIEKRGYS